MAGIFKSLDKSDVRITPFRTHKLWSDNLGYSYSTGSNSLRSLPLFLASLENINFSNYIYTIETGSKQVIRKIDITDDYTVLASNNIDVIGKRIQAIEVPPVGSADVIILGGIGDNNDIVINFISGSDLSTIRSNQVDSTNNPQTLYQIITGWDYDNTNRAFTFASTNTGLYSREIDISTYVPVGGAWQQHSSSANYGEYYASTPYIYGQSISGPSILSVVDSGGDPFLISHDMLIPNKPMWGGNSATYYDTTTSFVQNIGVPVKRFLVMHGSVSSQDVLWTLFDDGNLWMCKPNTPPQSGGDNTYMKLVATNIVDIQTDYDSIYNPNYSTQPYPNISALTRKLYIVSQNGIVYADATFKGSQLDYEEIIDCRQYVGPQNTITKTFITKNTDAPILGMYVNGGVQQSTLFTMNTKTHELSDPIFVGTLKDNIIFEADNKTDNVYAMRSYDGTTQYSTPDGASLLFEHWYKFTI
jgi:hypothetical protein